MNGEEIEKILKESFPEADIKLSDMTGGGDHWQLHIKAKEFAGKTLVEQHQLVYKALGSLMKQKIHALALTTEAA